MRISDWSSDVCSYDLLIRPDRLLTPVHPGQAPSHGDTTYFSCADQDGMMVSMIQSNFRGMGSGLVADGLGFMFQDRGRSEEHTSELQSLMRISYAVFGLKKKNNNYDDLETKLKAQS